MVQDLTRLDGGSIGDPEVLVEQWGRAERVPFGNVELD